MNNKLTPEVRPDINGKLVTKHVKNENPPAGAKARAVSTPPPPSKPEVDDTSMLSTDEVTAAVQALVYPERTNINANANIAFREYRENTRALELRWARWLGDEYASVVSESTQAAIFVKAWEDGHSSGYGNVESVYEDLALIVVAAYHDGARTTRDEIAAVTADRMRRLVTSKK